MTNYKKSNPRGKYMWGLGGKRIYLDNPDPNLITIEDIAVSLGKECRFGNMCKGFVSVAYHSVLVSAICPKKYRLHGLLHDASEAYLGDLIRPIKYIPEVYAAYRPYEEIFMKVIAKKFGFEYTEKTKAIIKEYDDIVGATEVRDRMELPDDEEFDFSIALNIDLSKNIPGPEESTHLFLDTYYEITGQAALRSSISRTNLSSIL